MHFYFIADDIREYLIHSGSSREELFLPPYRIRAGSEIAAEEIDPYESADLDDMVLISRHPLICKSTQDTTFSQASSSSNVQFVMDNHGCHLGFTRILVEGDAGVLSEELKKSVIHCDDGSYLSSEALLSSIYDPLSSKFYTSGTFKEGKLTRQGPAINIKSLDDDDSIKTIFDFDFVPTLKCYGLPQQLLSWQKRVKTRQWPPKSIQEQLFQSPCYVVGVGYHGSPNKDMEWRFSTSAIESVLASSLTLVQRKCYILFKILHKTALKEPKLLATYHLKNIMFEVLDETEGSPNMWTEMNLMQCLLLLLDKLISHLENGRLMSYFIDGYNLIDHYPPESIKDVLEKVKAVRKFPHKYLLMFDLKYAFDFIRNKIFQSDFEPYFSLYDQGKNDFQLLAHSIVISLIRHAHSDISTNDIVLYNRAFALLEDSWKIMRVVNPDFNTSQISFMSDSTYSGIEVDQSCKFQEFLRIKYPDAVELDENAKAIAAMLGLEVPVQGEANPVFKLLTYRMYTLQSFCEAKELEASGIQVMNVEIYSGTEPQTIAISGTMQRAMLKIALWMSKVYSPPVVTTPEELQQRKAAIAMEVLQEVFEELSKKSPGSETGEGSESLPTALTEMINMFPKLQVDHTTFENAREMEEMVGAAPKPSNRDTSTAKLTAYDLFIQYLNGNLDINLYLVSSYNMLFLFLMFGMKKEACRMLIRLNPTSLWVFSFLNSPFLDIELKNLNTYVRRFIFPDHLSSYIDTVSSCQVKVEFFQHYLLVECSIANPGFFDESEVEQAVVSAFKSVQNMNAKTPKQHCVFLLSVVYFRLKKFNHAQVCIESIVNTVDEECREIFEETLQLYQCLEMSLGI